MRALCWGLGHQALTCMSRARSLGMFVLLPLLECFNWCVKVFWDRLVMPKFNGHFGRVWSSKTQKRDGGSAIKSTHCTYKDTPTPAAVSFSTHAGQLAAAGTTCTSSFRESHITFRLLGHRIHMEHIYTVVFLHKNKKKTFADNNVALRLECQQNLWQHTCSWLSA